MINDDPTRFALAAMYLAFSEAVSLATEKPVGKLVDHLMRAMAENAPPGSGDFCLYLANLCDEAEQP